MKKMVAVLKISFARHRQDTDGFKWDYTAATDSEVMDTVQVAPETIAGLSQIILKIIKANQRQELKKQISYLIGLRHRQAEVWEKYIADCQNRTNNTNQWVQANQQ